MNYSDEATFQEYEPLSIGCGADGWRAVYTTPDAPDGFCLVPLVCWAVYEVTIRPCRGSRAPARADGRRICGVVLDADLGMERADDAVNFWKYLPPGAPDPTPAEAAAAYQPRAALEGNRAVRTAS